MKTHTLILALSLVAFSNLLGANPRDLKEKEEAETQVSDIIEIENLELDECVACPVPVQIFDENFTLIMTGEMTPMQETSSQKLQMLINQSNLIMDSGTALIYQLDQ